MASRIAIRDRRSSPSLLPGPRDVPLDHRLRARDLPDDARGGAASAALARNQGLYSGFLAAGLFWGLLARNESRSILTFFLVCVVIAGVFGAATAQLSILFDQALPAAIALVLVRRTEEIPR